MNPFKISQMWEQLSINMYHEDSEKRGGSAVVAHEGNERHLSREGVCYLWETSSQISGW